MNTLLQTLEREVYSVSQLNQETRLLLEQHFGLVWIEGELSNFVEPSSGHWYFSLKDERAAVRCAMFRSQNSRVDFTPENGMQVVLRAKVSVYEGRGDYQLIVDAMEETGDGRLRRAFEQLQKQLAAEGLFKPEHKKPLPKMPKQIGVLTSATGAAIRDILSVLKRRFPAIPVVIYPCEVQGATAAGKLAGMVELANQRDECDVLILSRGGGSLEDLWAFNEEVLARAIFASRIPIITGVGHEIDYTIADFVADVRAVTPSAAAETVVPDHLEYTKLFDYTFNRLIRYIHHYLQRQTELVQHLQKRLQHPGQLIQQQYQHLDLIEQRLKRAMRHRFQQWEHGLTQLRLRLQQHHPQSRIQSLQQGLTQASANLFRVIQYQIEQGQTQLKNLMRALDTVSPLATLNRGYAIATDKQGIVIQDVGQVAAGDEIDVRVKKGSLRCGVQHVIIE